MVEAEEGKQDDETRIEVKSGPFWKAEGEC
jgi:hypothetical protein